jgi:hypothetical protein
MWAVAPKEKKCDYRGYTVTGVFLQPKATGNTNSLDKINKTENL